MKVKNFKIPNFEEWNKNGQEFIESIGDYTCKIAVVAKGCNKNKCDIFNACIANYDNPTNINVKKVFSGPIECDRNDLKKIKRWYENTTRELNKVWEKFIIDSYFE